MGLEDVRPSVQNILAGKYNANMGIKVTNMGINVVSVSVKNILACKNLLHPWE